MKRLLPLLLLGLAGCSSIVETEREELPELASTGKVLYVGPVYDLRVQPATQLTAEGGDTLRAASTTGLVAQREIRIPVSEVRSVVADALARCKLFQSVLNPPAVFAGSTPDRMVQNAQQSSDYLLVGEVNQFHIKSVGYNSRAAFSIPMDLLLAPLTFGTYVTTAGNMFFFSGSLVACWTAEVVLTLSVSLIDTSSGNVVHTIRLEERVRSPYDGVDAFGSLWDETDDWIDLGRRLGEVALHNAAVELAKRLDEVLPREEPTQDDEKGS